MAAYREAKAAFNEAWNIYEASPFGPEIKNELKADAIDAMKIYDNAGTRLAYWLDTGLLYGLITVTPTDRDGGTGH